MSGMMSSPSNLLGMSPGGMGNLGMSGLPTDMLFDTNFSTMMGTGIDDFDASLFGSRDGDINFERDFGQWFNPDDVGVNLDLK